MQPIHLAEVCSALQALGVLKRSVEDCSIYQWTQFRCSHSTTDCEELGHRFGQG